MFPKISLKGIKSGGFLEEMKKRASSFRGQEVSARLIVPPDLSWWYWLEFGTATRQDASAPFQGRGEAYTIKPIDRSGDGYDSLEKLHWFSEDGKEVFAPSVVHPGIRPHPFVRSALADIRAQFVKDIGVALAARGDGSRFRAETIQATLMNETMTFAKSRLVANLTAVAGGTREDGRLSGNTAGDVFEEEAEIVDSTASNAPTGSRSKPVPKVRYVVTRTKGRKITKI